MFSNQHTKLVFCSSNRFFCDPPKNISEKFTWPEFHDQTKWMEGNHILSSDIWSIVFTDWFIKCYNGCIFFLYTLNLSIFLPLKPAIFGIANAQNSSQHSTHNFISITRWNTFKSSTYNFEGVCRASFLLLQERLLWRLW